MMFRNNRMSEKPEFMIVPMIDIIFFLLVFFMMNSLETVAQKSLAVQLPQAQTAVAQKQLPLILTLDVDGHIVIDGQPMDFATTTEHVKAKVAENPALAVVLQADKRTQHGQVVAIMDLLKQAGVKKFSIAAQS